MVNKLIITIVFLFSSVHFNAQKQHDSLTFSLKMKWNENTLKLNTQYISNNDTLQLNQLKFYISDIQIYFDDHSIANDKKYHLVDIEDINSTVIPICKNNNKTISKVIFSIGVDSLASVSGALADDLDPSKGMYWAWQSGYINMKIEGTSSSCKTRRNAFHYHIGGYLSPYYTLRKIILESQNDNFNIVMNLATLFNNLMLTDNNTIMIPGKKAMEFADLSAKIFVFE